MCIKERCLLIRSVAALKIPAAKFTDAYLTQFFVVASQPRTDHRAAVTPFSRVLETGRSTLLPLLQLMSLIEQH